MFDDLVGDNVSGRQMLDGVIFPIFVSMCHPVLVLIGGQTAKLIFRVSSNARSTTLQCDATMKVVVYNAITLHKIYRPLAFQSINNFAGN